MPADTISPSALADLHDSHARLERRESDFRQLADTMPQIVWGAQPDGSLDYYNRRWFEYINLEPGSIENARWDQYIHEEDLPRAYESWTSALQSGEPYGIEFRVRGGDGAYRWFLVRALPMRDAAGLITRWFGTCTDIHEKRALQASMECMVQEREELLASERAARSMAEHASRMKDEFLATLSHEIRSPLNAIFGWTQILRDGTQDPETLAEGLAVIDRNVRAQAQLIEDLLDMSRIISGKLRLDVQQVSPSQCIEAAIETVTPAATARGIRIERVLDPLAGPIAGDPGRIQQIMWNLLSNAIKFTPRGGKVQVVLRRVNSHLEISVADDGEGMDPGFLPHVFDRFRQADAAMNRKHGGLGLGLAIVKQLVELHGGSIFARSPGVGLGSTFIVQLPLQVVHTNTDDGDRMHPTSRHSSSRFSKSAVLQGVRVLVVDDEKDARELVKRFLSDCRAEVMTAGSAVEAIAVLKAFRPHVLVSDVGMPEVDGYEFLRRVRCLSPEDGGSTPAVALTAFARTEDRTRALNSGFLTHVSKPVEPSELVATVAAVARQACA